MRHLDVVLSRLMGRRLTSRDIYTALEMPKATYYAQRDEGRLMGPASLIRIARTFDVNPVVLLVEYGHITADEVARYSPEAHRQPDARDIPVLGALSDADQQQITVDVPTTSSIPVAQLAAVLQRALDASFKKITEGGAAKTS